MKDHPTGLVDMTNDEYHAAPGVSKSHLDDIHGRSLKHYWHKHVNPKREPEPKTPALIVGDAIHKAILEPDLFTSHFVAAPKIDRRSNAGKAEWAAFLNENAGKGVLSESDYETCIAIRDAVHSHPVAAGLLRNGRAEQSFFAIDPETGELVKCRPDYMLDSGDAIVDVKSTEDASPHAFGRSAANYRYHVQPPWYFDILDALYGGHPTHWVFLAVEKSPPYAIGIYYAQPEDIERGRIEGRRDFMRIVEARRADHWPDYGEEVLPLELPAWARR